MNDPTVVPWNVVWLGLVPLVLGVPLAMSAVDHPRPKCRATVGSVAIVLGIVLMVGPFVVNGTAILMKAFCAFTQEEKAPDSIRNDAYPQR